MRFLLIILVAASLLAAGARATDALWGWDGGDPQSPDVLRRHALTQAAWIRIPCHGSMVYSSKNSPPDWSQVDRDMNGWYPLGVKIILSTPFHPPDLTDAEIVPWMIAFNRQALARYGPKLIGIEPLNEPWFDNENVANQTSWAYLNARLGASHGNGSFYIVPGIPGPTTNSLSPQAVAWYAKMRNVFRDVRALAAPLGIKVYGPKWSNERYANETRMAQLLGVMDYIDVFSFSCRVEGRPDGPQTGHDGWATYIDKIKPFLGSRPWACTEFQLYHKPNGPPDPDAARLVRAGMNLWRKRGVQCVLIHTGLQNWVSTDKTDPADWRSLAGYIDNHPSESLRVLQVELAARP